MESRTRQRFHFYNYQLMLQEVYYRKVLLHKPWHDTTFQLDPNVDRDPSRNTFHAMSLIPREQARPFFLLMLEYKSPLTSDLHHDHQENHGHIVFRHFLVLLVEAMQ